MVSQYFTYGDNGSVHIADGSPEWLMDAVFAAHDGEWPNDWHWESCLSAVNVIEDGADEDGEAEFAETYASVYHSDILRWYWEDISRLALADEARDEYGDFDTVSDILRVGQMIRLRHVYRTMWEAIQSNKED